MLAHHIIYAVYNWAGVRVHKGSLLNCMAWTLRPKRLGQAWTIAVWQW